MLTPVFNRTGQLSTYLHSDGWQSQCVSQTSSTVSTPRLCLRKVALATLANTSYRIRVGRWRVIEFEVEVGVAKRLYVLVTIYSGHRKFDVVQLLGGIGRVWSTSGAVLALPTCLAILLASSKRLS